MKFYRCEICGNIITKLNDSGVPVVCCGKPMTELVPGAVDAAQEKHVPAVTVSGNKVTVQVGEVEHPMLDEHYIEWIAIRTTFGNQRKALKPEQAPKAQFALLPGEELVEAYAYCNLHDLWKS